MFSIISVVFSVAWRGASVVMERVARREVTARATFEDVLDFFEDS